MKIGVAAEARAAIYIESPVRAFFTLKGGRMSRNLKMLLGCLLPLLVIFLLPLFGLGQGLGLFLFIVLMFACHLLMMGSHDHRNPPK